jgi:cation efflux protein
MDGLEKNAIVHVCLEHVKHMDVCKESIRDLLKERGFQNVTIEVDSSLMNHAHHKRCVDELKSLDGHEH